MKARLLSCLLLLGGPLCAQEEQPALSISAPGAGVASGDAWIVQLIALNPGNTTLYYHPPSALKARANGSAQLVEFRTEESATLPIAPGSFATCIYVAKGPPDLTGTVALEFATGLPSSLYAALHVDKAQRPKQDSAEAPPSYRTLTNPTPAAGAVERTFAGRLGLHEPVYFIYGPKAPAAKFQLSFKYKVMDLTDPSEDGVKNTLQFGYTQRSLWDFNAVSSPFYDTSYMPELMWESLTPMPKQATGLFLPLGTQLALKHESNGRDGSSSRSLNIITLRAAGMIGPIDHWHVLVIPELFTYITPLDDNPDLKDYRGYGQLRVGIGSHARLPALMYTVRAGKDFNHWTQQLDFTVPFRTKWLNIETTFLLQYFNGYGESLLSYQKKSDALRAGFSLVR